MSELKGACIIGQSGGPTSVINASAYGVIETALKTACITQVLRRGPRHQGRSGRPACIDMGQEDPAELELLKYTPSSALGSCRYKMADPDVDDTDYKRILEIFKKYDVRYFFYNGGNDSMDTCNKISKYMQKVGYECRVMGVPKTIDNDLFGTDHCPGFASAAKYIATSCMEVYQDARVYDTGMITHHRDHGPSRRLAGRRRRPGHRLRLRSRPDLPARGGLRHGQVPGRRGAHLQGERATAWWPSPRASTMPTAPSSPRPRPLPPTASATPSWAVWPPMLADVVKEKTGAKVRGIELSLLQRCGAHLASETDIEEAYHGRQGRRGERRRRHHRQDGGLRVQP